MRQLEPSGYPVALEAYACQSRRFPLMAAVLEGRQGGLVLVDDLAKPSSFFVRNRFGFCFAFGPSLDADELFEAVLELGFPDSGKLRWYDPVQDLLRLIEAGSARGLSVLVTKRVQLEYTASGLPAATLPRGYRLAPLDAAGLAAVDQVLAVGSRYWDSPAQALEQALGVCVLQGGRLVGVCYAAGISGPDGPIAEIDVYLDEGYRGQGLGRAVAAAFIQACLARRVIPHWDCYANNQASWRLAKSLGFGNARQYSFANISRTPVAAA